MVSSLSPEFAMEVRDLLLNPPAEQLYEVLKKEVTNCSSISEQHHLQQLLTTLSTVSAPSAGLEPAPIAHIKVAVKKLVVGFWSSQAGP